MKLQLAPLKVPLYRRRQTLVVLQVFAIQTLSFFISIALFFSPLLPLMLAYVVFIMLDSAPVNGIGRKSEWFRRLKWWTYFRDYFPLTLVKTAELDPHKNYVFGYHPHGIISVGAFGNFATEATGFSELFPGIKNNLLTLSSNFKFPFFREYLLALGVADVSRKSCDNLLQRKNAEGKAEGNAITIVIGGAAEALDAHPGKFLLTLKQRKGFVRVAISNGASLVPVLSFGETDVYEQMHNPKGSKLRHYQEALQKKLGFSTPLFNGRGIFNYSFGILPHRKPITTIVGEPIDVPHTAHPTDELVDEYHQRYIKALEKMYEDYKDVYYRQTSNPIFAIQ